MVDFGTPVAQKLMDRSSPKFQVLVDGYKGLFTQLSFFDFSRDVTMATNYSRKIGVFPGPIYFVVLPFGNGLQYRNSDFKMFNRINFSTLCTILVAFSPETSEFTLSIIAPFAAIRQKSAYHAKYLRISWTFLDLLYRFGRSIGGMIIPMFVCQSPKGCCYGNQLNL